jgi:osmotically-inducible protein OsmY
MIGGLIGGVMGGVFRGRGPKNWRRDDSRIHDEVCERLTAHSEIDATDIEVTVRDGEVTLEGTVYDRHEKYLAEDVVDDVLGVRDVHNRLRLSRGSVTPSSPAAAARR